VRAVNEKHAVVNVVFLAKFSKERMSDSFVCRWVNYYVWQFVYFGIDSGIQPILLVIESDHGFVNRNVIRTPTRFGL